MAKKKEEQTEAPADQAATLELTLDTSEALAEIGRVEAQVKTALAPAEAPEPPAEVREPRGSNHESDSAAQPCDVTIGPRVRPVKASSVPLRLADGRSPAFARNPPTTKAIKLTPAQQRDLSARGWLVTVKE